jgi:hypothetical protein
VADADAHVGFFRAQDELECVVTPDAVVELGLEEVEDDLQAGEGIIADEGSPDRSDITGRGMRTVESYPLPTTGAGRVLCVSLTRWSSPPAGARSTYATPATGGIRRMVSIVNCHRLLSATKDMGPPNLVTLAPAAVAWR